MDQLRAGGPDAWQCLARLYGPVIYRWRRRSNLTAEDAADVVQDVLSAVMVHLPTFRRDARRIWVNLDDAEYIRERLNVPDCRIAIRADREVRSADGALLLHESRYFVTGLDPDTVTAAELHATIGKWKTACTSSRIAGGTKTATAPSGPASPSRLLR